jgi:hypothetical protein
MNTFWRVTLVVGCLAACLGGQRILGGRLRAASLEPLPVSAPPLELLPEVLGRWRGEDETIGAADRASTADLQRLYFHADTGQAVRVVLRYIAAGGAEAPAPLVAGPAETTTFCWYYALPVPDDSRFDLLERAYRRLRLRPAYVAVDVAVPAGDATDPAAAVELVRFLDAAVRQLLGPAAGRYGSFDTPIVAARS